MFFGSVSVWDEFFSTLSVWLHVETAMVSMLKHVLLVVFSTGPKVKVQRQRKQKSQRFMVSNWAVCFGKGLNWQFDIHIRENL